MFRNVVKGFNIANSIWDSFQIQNDLAKVNYLIFLNNESWRLTKEFREQRTAQLELECERLANKYGITNQFYQSLIIFGQIIYIQCEPYQKLNVLQNFLTSKLGFEGLKFLGKQIIPEGKIKNSVENVEAFHNIFKRTGGK